MDSTAHYWFVSSSRFRTFGCSRRMVTLCVTLCITLPIIPPLRVTLLHYPSLSINSTARRRNWYARLIWYGDELLVLYAALELRMALNLPHRR